MSGTRIILVRHGESQVMVDKIIGGPRKCSGLSVLGRRQAEALNARWTAEGFESPTALIASNYKRAIETANLIAPSLGHPELLIDADWGEHDPGEVCDGMSYTDFVDKFGHRDWSIDPYDETYPGGETVAAFQFRVGGALRRTVDTYPGGTVVVACHAGVIDTCLRHALRSAPVGEFEVHTMNTSITELIHVRPGRWRVVRYNDAAHLAGLPSAISPSDMS